MAAIYSEHTPVPLNQCPASTDVFFIRAPKMDRIIVQTRPLNDEQWEAAKRDGWQVARVHAEFGDEGMLLVHLPGNDAVCIIGEQVLP